MEAQAIGVVVILHHLLGRRMRPKERVFKFHLSQEVLCHRQVDISTCSNAQLMIPGIMVAINLCERWTYDKTSVERLGLGLIGNKG